MILPPEGTKERPKPKEIDGYVGFANLPNQVYRKAVKRGFEFTLMVVGSYSFTYFLYFKFLLTCVVHILSQNIRFLSKVEGCLLQQLLFYLFLL